MFKKTLLAGMTTATLLAASASYATVAVGTFDLNFVDAAAALGSTATVINPTGIHALGYRGQSIVTYSPDLKSFDDYIILTVDTFKDPILNPVNPGATYGSFGTHTLTIVAHLSGTQNLGAGSFSLDTVHRFGLYFDIQDSDGVVGSYTSPDFSDVTTFADGLLVEEGVSPASGGGTITPGVNPSTDINFTVQLLDQLSALTGGDPFEFNFLPDVADSEIVFGTGTGTNDLDLLSTALFDLSTIQYG